MDEKMNEVYTSEVYTSREAAKLWDLSPNTVTQWCNRGRFQKHEARKSAGTWLVSRAGMIRLTGYDIKEGNENE